MLQFLTTLPVSILMLLGFLMGMLAIIWCIGARWCWRFLEAGTLRHPALRGPIAVTIWPVWLLLVFIASRIAVVQAILAACLLGAVLLQPGPAAASDLIMREGNDSVRLTDSPCSSELVLGRLTADQHEDFHAASAVFQGQQFIACWRAMGNVAFLIYEDGDQGVIPLQQLHPALDI